MNGENDEYNNQQVTKKTKQGIGGWLLFFTITIFLHMFSALLSIFDGAVVYIANFNSMSLYYKAATLFILLTVVISFITSLLVLVQIIRKNAAGIYASILLCFLIIFMEIINLILLGGTSLFVLIYVFAWGTIWISYFNKSKRVQNTLINESSGQWVKSVASIGGGILTIGYVAGFIFHIYTSYLAFKLYGFAGLIGSFMLPVITEVYMFIISIVDSGTFYNYYSILTSFYIVMTFGVGIALTYLSEKMENDEFYV